MFSPKQTQKSCRVTLKKLAWSVWMNWAVTRQCLCWWSFQVIWSVQWLYCVVNLNLAESRGQSRPCVERERRRGRRMTDARLRAAHFPADSRTLCQRLSPAQLLSSALWMKRVCVYVCGGGKFWCDYRHTLALLLDIVGLMLHLQLRRIRQKVGSKAGSKSKQQTRQHTRFERQRTSSKGSSRSKKNLLCARHPSLQSLM